MRSSEVLTTRPLPEKTGPVTDPPVNCLQYRFSSVLTDTDLFSHLELLELLLGAGVEDVGRVRVGCRELRCLQPVFEAREVVQELTPETPGLLDPDNNTGDQ